MQSCPLLALDAEETTVGLDVEIQQDSWGVSLSRRRSNRLPTHEGLDDDHRCSAAGANKGRWRCAHGRRLIRRWPIRLVSLGRKKRPHPHQALPTPGIGQQSIVSNTVEAGRQHMQQKPAHELPGAGRHRLGARFPLDPVILPAERDPLRVQRNESPIRDGHPIGIA